MLSSCSIAVWRWNLRDAGDSSLPASAQSCCGSSSLTALGAVRLFSSSDLVRVKWCRTTVLVSVSFSFSLEEVDVMLYTAVCGCPSLKCLFMSLCPVFF